MILNSHIARAVLRIPDGETGGGAAAAVEAPASDPLNLNQRSAFEKSLETMFATVDGGKPNKGGTTDPLKGEGEGGEGQPGAGEGEGGEGTGTGEGEGGEGQPGAGEGEGGEGTGTGEGEGGEGQPTGEQEYRTLMKRVGKLLQRNDQLQARITELETTAPSGRTAAGVPGEVERLTRPDQLADLQSTTEGNLETVQGLIGQLGYAPENVEEFLREQVRANPALAERFKGVDDDGKPKEDYSVKKMAKVLAEIEGNFKATLKAIPKRQEFLTHRSHVARVIREPEVLKIAPFIKDQEDEGHEQMLNLMRLSPDLRNAPNGEVLAAAAVLGLRMLNPGIAAAADRLQGKAPAKPGTPGKGGTRMPAVPGGGGGKAGAGKFSAAKAAFLKDPSKANLTKALDAL